MNSPQHNRDCAEATGRAMAIDALVDIYGGMDASEAAVKHADYLLADLRDEPCSDDDVASAFLQGYLDSIFETLESARRLPNAAVQRVADDLCDAQTMQEILDLKRVRSIDEMVRDFNPLCLGAVLRNEIANMRGKIPEAAYCVVLTTAAVLLGKGAEEMALRVPSVSRDGTALPKRASLSIVRDPA